MTSPLNIMSGGEGAPSATAFPAWGVANERRRAHVGRVVALLNDWSVKMSLRPDEAAAWRDAGWWHDALRDADERTLRAMTGELHAPVGLLHGPAAALRLEAHGEQRLDVLEAVRWHTVGNASWTRTGRALYMADFLEPGRTFMQADRAFLAKLVTTAFDEVFRTVCVCASSGRCAKARDLPKRQWPCGTRCDDIPGSTASCTTNTRRSLGANVSRGLL